ncbi:MAG TPA: hypothetical protein VMC80_01090 [Patescibacteria group bacterium]|nr:hypothetical protein [Patescibacteria group bacterium]
MASTINMQDMRYLNLFEKITKIGTRFYFVYNGTIFFCVPKHLISKAVGEEGRNVRTMNNILRKRIRIIPMPIGIQHIRPFIETIVSPVTFKDVEVKDSEVILNAGNTQNKAALMGRNKVRLSEMQKIIHDFFGKEFRIA